MKIKLDKQALLAGIEELKKKISREVSDFENDTPAKQKQRIKACQRNLRKFAETYFPHYLSHKPSELHEYLFSKYVQIILSGAPKRFAVAAPRGNAKSTITSLILPIWCVCYGYKHFIAIFSNSFTQAAEFLEFIKAELEANERLRRDFPDATGEGHIWQFGHVITNNMVKIKAWGVRQRLLGARHLQYRPDLCIYDDLEDPEELLNPENRKKTEKWFFDKAFNIGDVSYTDHIAVGTIHHEDCLLKKLINRFGGRTFKSVIKWSTSPLWEKWEEIYAQDHSENKQKARGFFEKHKDEMLKNTKVLWPEKEDYYTLMCLRQDIGPHAFDCAKQNDPSESSMFSEEWLVRWAYEETEIIGKNLIFFASCDPSMGKTFGAPSAIIILGKEASSPVCYVVVADIKKRHPDQIIEDLIEYQINYRCINWVFEVVQLQEYLKDRLIVEAGKKGVPLPISAIRPKVDKDIRIQSLQPYLANGTIRLPKKMKAGRDNPLNLWHQLKNYPKAMYRDGPDALEMAFSQTVTFSMSSVKSAKRRESKSLLRGYWT